MLLLAREIQAYEKLTRGNAASQIPAALDAASFVDEDDGMRMGKMYFLRSLSLIVGFLCTAGLLSARQQTPAPDPDKDKSAKATAPVPNSRLTIEVTGGDSNVPIENASVYVKTIEQHLIKDKKFEVNVKTNQNGTAHVPDAPLGRVLIQIVAEGWKPYGHWYDITDPKQVVKIHLERPPRWY